MSRVVESDVCIIGAGISAAMVAERLAERTTASIAVVEAGGRTASLEERSLTRARMLAYGENPYPNDHIPGQTGTGAMYRSMVVGGSGMHWGGAVPRYSPEDFRARSLYGVGDDWPISFNDLEPYYQEAEERIGAAGEQGPPEYDPRSKPYPMPPLPLSYNLARMREWTDAAGIPFWTQPWARNTEPYRGRNVCQRCDTCAVCPTGAKYTPDFAFDQLLADGRIELVTRTLVRRLAVEPGTDRIAVAEAVDRDAPDEPVEFRAGTFVIAAGHAWSSHLLLLSASSRYPDGLANSTGNVGRFMTGHWYASGFIDLPMRLYPRHLRQQQPAVPPFRESGAAGPLPAPRPAAVGVGRGSCPAPEGRRRSPPLGRRDHGRLAGAHRGRRHHADPRLLRRDPRPGQPPDPRWGDEERHG